MKFKEYIEEEYAFSGREWTPKNDAPPHPIYTNPSKKEIADAAKGSGNVRFCIDLHQKKLYVWNAYLLHDTMARHGEKEGFLAKGSYDYKDAVRNPYVWAVAMVEAGKLQIIEQSFTEGSNIDFDILFKKIDKWGKLDWLKHWFTQDSYNELTEE